jgi:thioester reductase-like protein
LKGDITEKNLGLGDEELRLISGKVDTIIHCAAITDHMGRAELFNRVNVAGTRNVVNLTKTLNAALIHISTGSVSGTYYVNDLKKKGPFSEDDYDIGQNYADNEYVRTKFIAEGFVIDALKQGINARIIRVGTLTGTTGGKFQSNPARNAFANRIVSICNIGSVPESALGISIEMTPVDACADAIVRLALLDEKRAVHHVYNTRRITVADLLDMLKQSDIYIDVLPDETFRQKVSALVRKGKLAMVSGLVSELSNFQIEPAIRITAEKTSDSLMRAGFSWPEIDPTYIRKFISCLGGIRLKEN